MVKTIASVAGGGSSVISISGSAGCRGERGAHEQPAEVLAAGLQRAFEVALGDQRADVRVLDRGADLQRGEPRGEPLGGLGRLGEHARA